MNLFNKKHLLASMALSLFVLPLGSSACSQATCNGTTYAVCVGGKYEACPSMSSACQYNCNKTVGSSCTPCRHDFIKTH